MLVHFLSPGNIFKFKQLNGAYRYRVVSTEKNARERCKLYLGQYEDCSLADSTPALRNYPKGVRGKDSILN